MTKHLTQPHTYADAINHLTNEICVKNCYHSTCDFHLLYLNSFRISGINQDCRLIQFINYKVTVVISRHWYRHNNHICITTSVTCPI